MGQLQILPWQRPEVAPIPLARSKLATPFEQAVMDDLGLRRWATTSPPPDGTSARSQWETRARQRALAEIRGVLMARRACAPSLQEALALDGLPARTEAAVALSKAGHKMTVPSGILLRAPRVLAWGVTGDVARDNWIVQSVTRDALAILFSWRAKGRSGQVTHRHAALVEPAGDLGLLLLDMAARKTPHAVEVWTDFVKERHGALLALEKDRAGDRLPQITAEHFQVFAPVEVPNAR